VVPRLPLRPMVVRVTLKNVGVLFSVFYIIFMTQYLEQSFPFTVIHE
jgi:hypothetical protein